MRFIYWSITALIALVVVVFAVSNRAPVALTFFPLPAELHRERLWRGMFPARTPVAADLDFAFLARQFHLTGGQIRSVSVEAAFLAAADGRRITMPLIVKAVARHFVKQGHMPAAHEFREYFQFATEG